MIRSQCSTFCISSIRNDATIKSLVEQEQNKIKRDKKCGYKRQQAFVKPKPNNEVDDYIEFTAESESNLIYEPPFTKDHSKNELKQFIDAKLDLNICNNLVLTERTIRDMTDVATKSTSSEKREAMIYSIRRHRQEATSK